MELETLDVGENISFRNGKVLIMKWKDKKDVRLISTVHKNKIVTKDGYSGTKEIPQLVHDYNFTMGGVDLFDQKNSCYKTGRKRVKKFFLSIFYYLLDMSIWNSYHIYKLDGNENVDSFDYRMKLVDEIIKKYGVVSQKITFSLISEPDGK